MLYSGIPRPTRRSNPSILTLFFVTMYFILLVMGGPRLLVNNNKPIRINELDSCCYSCWPSACHWVLAKHNLASIVVQQMVQCLLNWIFPHFNICPTAVMLICATDNNYPHIFWSCVGVERALVMAALCCWSDYRMPEVEYVYNRQHPKIHVYICTLYIIEVSLDTLHFNFQIWHFTSSAQLLVEDVKTPLPQPSQSLRWVGLGWVGLGWGVLGY